MAVDTSAPPLPEDLTSEPAALLATLVDAGSFEPWQPELEDGVLAGTAAIGGREVCVWAQDPSFRGGSLGSVGGARIARLLRHADVAGLPIVGIPQSGGARLQEGVAALDAYGAIFREQALCRSPQITIVAGACAGGAAYSASLGHIVIMLGPRAKLFLTGPRVTAEVTREEITAEELGGPRVHAANGVAHLTVADMGEASTWVQELLSHFSAPAGDGSAVVEPVTGDPGAPLPGSSREVYDVREVIAALVDGSRHLELAPRWARNLVTTLARIDGHSVGVIANQPRYRGGIIDCAASEKGTWFVDLCDRFRLPIVALVDTPGFLPGASQERTGVIRYGALLLQAFARATTTKLTVTLRNAYGGAYIVMNSRGLGADLTLAWPDARVGVMGARQAVAILQRRAIAEGADPDRLADQYSAEQLQVDVAAGSGQVDEVVAPTQTRSRLAQALRTTREGRVACL